MKKLRISNTWLNVEEEKQGIYDDWYPVLVLSPGQADKFYNITFSTEKKQNLTLFAGLIKNSMKL